MSECLGREEQFWLENEAGKTPASTTLNKQFLDTVQPGASVIDMGCGWGRAVADLSQRTDTIVGVDINRSELDHGSSLYPGVHFIEADAGRLPLDSNLFDTGVELALLGGVHKEKRLQILREAGRTIKPGGLFYLAEFARIMDPSVKNVDGIFWHKLYEDHAEKTGENGSFVVHNPDRSPRFIAHHFGASEIVDNLESCGFELAGMEQVVVQSAISGEPRLNWNVWARNHNQ